MSDLIRTETGADGVMLAVIDMPGHSMNVFSAELMDALDALMDRVEGDPSVKSVVVTSGKQSFLAGADLTMVRGFCDAARSAGVDELRSLCGRLGRQFVRLEASAKPWVAAVNGLALGGGLELAMACRARLVADDARIQLGLPEVRWGLLPGAGGTQRLPRLAGFELAMDLLLSGRSLTPEAAVAVGLFAEALPAAQLLDAARATARTLQGMPYDPAAKFAHLGQADVPPYSENEARVIATRQGVDAGHFDHYPAYGAIIEAVLNGARAPLAQATAIEMEAFLRLMYDPVAGRMVRTLFLERLRAERELAPPRDVKIESLRFGAISPVRNAWSRALAQTRLPQSHDASLPADLLELVDHNGARHKVALRVVDEPANESTQPYIVLAPVGPYGQAVEIVGEAHASVSVLAARLRAVPWRTRGPLSVLQSLRGAPLAQQAGIARAILDPTADPAFADVAACLSGVSPAWSGGPLSWQA